MTRQMRRERARAVEEAARRKARLKALGYARPTPAIGPRRSILRRFIDWFKE